MDISTIISLISSVTKLIASFRRTQSWKSEEERKGFEAQIRKELDILFDDDPDNDPERWRKPYQYLEPGQENKDE